MKLVFRESRRSCSGQAKISSELSNFFFPSFFKLFLLEDPPLFRILINRPQFVLTSVNRVLLEKSLIKRKMESHDTSPSLLFSIVVIALSSLYKLLIPSHFSCHVSSLRQLSFQIVFHFSQNYYI